MIASFASAFRWSLAASLILSAASVSCGPAEADEAPGAVDGSLIESEPGGGVATGRRTMAFRAAAGAAAAGAWVIIFNLEDSSSPFAVQTDSGGGFDFEIEATTGDELRFIVETDARRYPPVDLVTARSEDRDVLTPAARHECLRMVPALEVTLEGDLGQIGVYNECDETLSVAGPRLRAGTLGQTFDVVTLMPVVLEPGSSAGLELRVAGAVQPEADVLFLDAELGGASIRYGIGLYASE